MTACRRPGGFTLVEVVVALVILSVATAATTELLLLGARQGRSSDYLERLLWAATGVADSLSRATGSGSGGAELTGVGRLEWEGGENGGWVEATPAGSDSAWVRLPVTPTAGRSRLGGER